MDIFESGLYDRIYGAMKGIAAKHCNSETLTDCDGDGELFWAWYDDRSVSAMYSIYDNTVTVFEYDQYTETHTPIEMYEEVLK